MESVSINYNVNCLNFKSLDDPMNGRRLWIRVQRHYTIDTPLAQL